VPRSQSHFRHRFQSRGLQQALPRGVLAFVDHRTVPGQFVGAPEDDGDQSDVERQAETGHHAAEFHEPGQHHQHGQRQRDGEQRGVLAALVDRDPSDQHRGKYKTTEGPAHPALVFALVKRLDQEENQAADQDHDQRRTDGDHDIVGQRFLRLGHRRKPELEDGQHPPRQFCLSRPDMDVRNSTSGRVCCVVCGQPLMHSKRPRVPKSSAGMGLGDAERDMPFVRRNGVGPLFHQPRQWPDEGGEIS
jgi:hypothetical protein